MSERVVALTADALLWTFGSEHPTWRVGGGYRTIAVDPFPCYAHDREVVATTLSAAEAAFPVRHPPTVYVLDREHLSRTNGWADKSPWWDEENESGWDGWVVLSGKRIPPHPALTRYVTAHEYGHHVDWEIARQRGFEQHGSELHDEYAELRGLAEVSYGGGTWHAHVGELLANDFRLLVAEVETEYWPHPGFARPEHLPEVERWWQEALA